MTLTAYSHTADATLSSEATVRGGGRDARRVCARMLDDLVGPGALGLVNRWAIRLLADAPTRITPADVARARLVRVTVDALPGIRLGWPALDRQAGFSACG